MPASISKLFAYSILILGFFSIGLNAEAKTIVIGTASDTVSIPGTLSNSGLSGGTQYWNLNGTSLYASSTSYNVGIGTTNPTAGNKLHVAGNFTTSGSVSFSGATFVGGGNRMITVDNSGVLGAGAIPGDIYWTGTATNLDAVTARSSLGLGALATLSSVTTSQITDGTIANIDISGSANIVASKIQYGTYFIPSAGVDGQVWTSDGNGPGYWNTPSVSSTTLTGLGTANYLSKFTATSTIGNSILYDNGTNVGIGLTNPTLGKLQVNGNITIDGMQTGTNGLFGYNGSGSHIFSIQRQDANGVGTISLSAYGGIGLTAAKTTGSEASNFHLFIRSTGNVGIGTTAPTSKLVVNGTGVFSGAVTVPTPTANGHAATKGYVDAAIVALPSGSSGQTLRHNGSTWVADSNIYNNSSNVGIGTTTPGTYKLKVAGQVAATGFIYDSDRNLKKDIRTLDNSLEKILALRGVSFTWKENNVKSIGVIAQEVEEVYPELVTTNNGTKSVQYGNLIAPLIEAVKAQQLQIEKLEQRISELENK